jgi:hypothetical protein
MRNLVAPLLAIAIAVPAAAASYQPTADALTMAGRGPLPAGAGGPPPFNTVALDRNTSGSPLWAKRVEKFEALRGTFGTQDGSPALFDGTTPLSVKANPIFKGEANESFAIRGTYAGQVNSAGQIVYNLLYGVDAVAATAANSVANVANYYEIHGTKGARIAQQTSMSITGNTNDSPGNGLYFIGDTVNATTNGSLGGTASSHGGNLFGMHVGSQLQSGGKYVNGLAGLEVDVGAQTGSSVLYKNGIASILQGGDAIDPSAHPSFAFGIGLNVDSPHSPGWGYGLSFGGPSGWWPMNTKTGIMIYADPAHYAGSPALQAATGIDFSAVKFLTAFIKSTGFLVDGTGNVSAASYKVGATAGVTCSGSPTSQFATVKGIVVHC